MQRLIVLTSFFALTAGPALAGDAVLDIKTKSVGAGNVITVDCSHCPPLKEKDTGPDVHGVELVETEIGGTRKVVQTDNMMGGSAVRYVRAATPEGSYSGEAVTQTAGGTSVTGGNSHGTIHIERGVTPIVADGGTTFSGGGEFNVEEVGNANERRDGVDGASQTSSVNMNDAQHDNAGAETVEGGEEPHNPGPEIIDLRPTH
ncbi:plant virulence effector HPE1-like domain-containing protein [Hoeflea prorocentri]|uniref:Plant virulence effector HPE1-like domain-containing protein n=1 Tax=Hoeflea prorocentri TaxID=1922333 RepID=A0A9X3ZHE6_9HYPH|nr:plant virulence effector HPE1-like domain-containing protein [Hoeflea prorocentri]MCY6381702.1 plant virulence effector HPE1-like domain-containing protein [Hoeflea prorocentri]MDA5399502.1 plant virulence effector HPE1-like domain-containing protein [Hoeflea prorocentri]